MVCTRCQGTGFLNVHQLPSGLYDAMIPYQEPYLHSHLSLLLVDPDWRDAVLKWMENHSDTDVQVCDCCGNGGTWWGEPGQHDAQSGEPWPPECI